MRSRCLLCVALASACVPPVAVIAEGRRPAPRAPAVAVEPADAALRDDATAPHADAPPERAVAVIATASGDLDGDGVTETVRLYDDGALRVFHGADEQRDTWGGAAGRVVPFEALAADPSGGAAYALRVVDIDRRDRQRELMLVSAVGDEDPPGAHAFWRYNARHLWPMLRRPTTDDTSVTVPHGVTPTVAGDGEVRFDYDRCVRDADPDRGASGLLEHVALRFVLSDGVVARGELTENLRTSRRPSNCVQAACPVVRVGRSMMRAGEILRDLRSERRAQWQPLALPRSAVDADGMLRVSLVEEKREVTHLDGVYVDADGRALLPESCDDDEAHACATDPVRAELTPGRSLALRFRVGDARAITLWAFGYYVPLSSVEGDGTR